MSSDNLKKIGRSLRDTHTHTHTHTHLIKTTNFKQFFYLINKVTNE